MQSTQLRHSVMLLFAAFFWGTTFVAQDIAADTLPTFTYTAIRSFVAVGFLWVVMQIFDRRGIVTHKPASTAERKTLWIGGLFCGCILFASTNLQQYGMADSTAGKAGFITAMYIILVPIVGIFFGKHFPWTMLLGTIIALIGLYLLCMTGSEGLQSGDFFILLCAFCFTAHILMVDHFSPLVDGVRLSWIQFFVVGALSSLCAVFTEHVTFSQVLSCTGPILYAGILSSGVAYTLQILGQKNLNPTIAGLVMSVESVFSVLASWLFLHESMSTRQIIGCVLMFLAILLAQIPSKTTTTQKDLP